MIEKDTIKLLRECDAGVKMGTKSISDVLDNVKNEKLRVLLADCKEEHSKLDVNLQSLLTKYHDDGKDPQPVASAMSWLKTNVKLAIDDSDKQIADLMTDGCDMGVKSLSRYLNQYAAADEQSKDIAKKLIAIESKLSEDLRAFL